MPYSEGRNSDKRRRDEVARPRRILFVRRKPAAGDYKVGLCQIVASFVTNWQELSQNWGPGLRDRQNGPRTKRGRAEKENPKGKVKRQEVQVPRVLIRRSPPSGEGNPYILYIAYALYFLFHTILTFYTPNENMFRRIMTRTVDEEGLWNLKAQAVQRQKTAW